MYSRLEGRSLGLSKATLVFKIEASFQGNQRGSITFRVEMVVERHIEQIPDSGPFLRTGCSHMTLALSLDQQSASTSVLVCCTSPKICFSLAGLTIYKADSRPSQDPSSTGRFRYEWSRRVHPAHIFVPQCV
jgi:hypothetical protein